MSISFHWVTNPPPNSGLRQQVCVYFPVVQEGNLSSLTLFSGSIVDSALLDWSPPRSQLGTLLGVCDWGLFYVVFHLSAGQSQSYPPAGSGGPRGSKRASPMHEHFASLCLHLICYDLNYQSESHGQVQSQ